MGKKITLKLVEKLIPSNWCDPLLSGHGVPPLPWNCPEIERLLFGIKARLKAACREERRGGNTSGRRAARRKGK